MKRNEIIVYEHKKGVRAVKYNEKPQSHIESPKPNNPVAKNANAAIGGGAAGAHKDAKKASQSVRGQKHKSQPEMAEGYNPNSVAAQHARDLKAHQRAELKKKAETGDERAKAMLKRAEENDEARRADFDARMERESVAQEGRKYYGYDDSGMSLRPGNDEGPDSWDYSAAHDRIGAGDPRPHRNRSSQTDAPHDVHINGRKWKTFGSKSHAENVARKLAANGKKVTVQAASTDEAAGDALGTVSSATPDGKVSIKTATGDEIQTDKDALIPGANGTVQMKPDAAGDALKPGAKVVSTEDTAEEDMMIPPTDSSSPINGDEEHDEIRDLRKHLKRLAGL